MKFNRVNSSVGAACIGLTGGQVAPGGANTCYAILVLAILKTQGSIAAPK